MTITFLGTSSGVPTLQRMLPCVALEREGELLLFDCGEAAQVGFRRWGLRWGKLTSIFISHLHGDHITGLMGLLMSLQMADRTEPLLLYGPPGLERYVRTSQKLLNTGFGYLMEFIESRDGGVLRDLEEYRVTALPLEHRTRCLGFRLEEPDRPGAFNVAAARALGIPAGPLYGRLQRGESVSAPGGRAVQPEEVLGPPRPGRIVAYVSDTRPCASGVELGRHTDLLIHEGTFAADAADEALAKGHSTVAHAAEVARRADARRLVITHLSPRYADTRELAAQARAIFPASEIAHDGLVVEVPLREA